MALDKAIRSGKEKRKPFHGSAAFDASCRNGDRNPCPYCVSDRTIKSQKNRIKERELLDDDGDEDIFELDEIIVDDYLRDELGQS